MLGFKPSRPSPSLRLPPRARPLPGYQPTRLASAVAIQLHISTPETATACTHASSLKIQRTAPASISPIGLSGSGQSLREAPLPRLAALSHVPARARRYWLTFKGVLRAILAPLASIGLSISQHLSASFSTTTHVPCIARALGMHCAHTPLTLPCSPFRRALRRDGGGGRTEKRAQLAAVCRPWGSHCALCTVHCALCTVALPLNSNSTPTAHCTHTMPHAVHPLPIASRAPTYPR